MERRYFKTYSSALGQDMECIVWGNTGHPVLFIPCQNGRFFDFENFGMRDHLAPWIDAGDIMVCGVDSIDRETYSSFDDPRERILRHEQWIIYLTEEVVPFLQNLARETGGPDAKTGILSFGCSMGATHAANLYLRFPYLFDGMLSLSGIFSSSHGFGDYSDELVYLNSPVDFLPGLQEDHPYMKLYRRQRGVICCGQGDWEHTDTVWQMKDILAAKNIPIWVDPWGLDVNHDWPWWFKQAEYYLPFLLGEEEWPLELTVPDD